MVKAFRLTTPDLERKDTYKLPCDVTLSKYISPLIDSRDWKTSTPKYIRIEAQGLTNTDKAIINFVDTEAVAMEIPSLSSPICSRFSFLFQL